MNKDNPAIETINEGEVIIFETADCYNDQIRDESTLFEDIIKEDNNPATGPLYINGADPGDTLKIEIQDIRIADFGVMTARPGNGILGDVLQMCKSKIVPIKNKIAQFNEYIQIPINPMIGVIGTAPKNGSIKTTIPGKHGANLDCKRIIKGSTVYLPVFHEGGLLSIGDLHAVMSDGEVVICGLEIAGEVSIKIEILKNQEFPLPMVTTQKSISFLSSYKTLDEAAEKATHQAHRFLTDQVGMETHEAAQLLSLVGNLRVCQIVNDLRTARMEIPRYILEKYDSL